MPDLLRWLAGVDERRVRSIVVQAVSVCSPVITGKQAVKLLSFLTVDVQVQ